MAFRGLRDMARYVIEVNGFNFEDRSDLEALSETSVASQATKMAVRGNMHMDNQGC